MTFGGLEGRIGRSVRTGAVDFEKPRHFVRSRHWSYGHQDLCEFEKRAVGRSRTIRLGPGVMGPDDFVEKRDPLLLLMGKAGHKRNGLAAEALASSGGWWRGRLSERNVSENVKSILSGAFHAARLNV